MVVVDASALLNALADDGPVGTAARSELRRDEHWAGPDHLVVEVFSGLRGLRLGGRVDDRRADDVLAALAEAAIDVRPVAPLLGRMWELRSNVGGYDAAYVALAETLGCALVTADVRLARAAGVRCEVRLALPPPG